MITNKTGVWGELYAARYLRQHKYLIVGSGFRSRFGEIDIIAQKNGKICFVEVKTRNKNTALRPMEAVDSSKQKKLILTAEYFIAKTGIDAPMRFDVCEVYVNDDDTLYKINYIKNAFET